MGVQELKQEAIKLYERHFGSDASSDDKICSMAPGRVNLIGEHVDYTGGFVFPIAIDYATVIYGSFVNNEAGDKGQSVMEIVSSSEEGNDEVVKFSLVPSEIKPFDHSEDSAWANYVMGIVLEYIDPLLSKSEGSLIVKAAIVGDVPLGGGLSSSASLEVSTATFLEGYIAKGESKSVSEEELKQIAVDRAIKCRHSSNTFCGVPCGIMDQFVTSAGMAGCALLIDCQDNTFIPVKMGAPSQEDEKAVIVVTNSNVKHSHANGEYPVRVRQCKEATDAIQTVKPSISSLRHASMADLNNAKSHMSELIYQRGKHVISENERTLAAKDAFEQGDMNKFGELMNGSHFSMKNDYEVSCEEIDFLVEKAAEFPGVFGSRLTGGGFGGCTVTLVTESQSNSLIEHLQSEYEKAFQKTCDCFITSPGAGACLLSVDVQNFEK